MLPNLSLLRLGADREAAEDDDELDLAPLPHQVLPHLVLPLPGEKRNTITPVNNDEYDTDDSDPRASPPLKGTRPPALEFYLHKVWWSQTLGRLRNRMFEPPIEFTARAQRPGEQEWVMQFEATAKQLSMTTAGGAKVAKCVEVTVSSARVKVDGLFFGLTKAQKETCKIYPGAGAATGQGSVVLQVIDVIASDAFNRVQLYDVSGFESGTGPLVQTERLTDTLCLYRGYGYYEARGYVSTRLVDATPNISELPLATSVDLLWTHTITTTPIRGLEQAIRTFHTQLSTRSGVPDYTRALYSEEFCTAHATRAKLIFIDNFVKKLIAAEAAAGCPERLGKAAYQDLSMRQLANATNAGLISSGVWSAEQLSLSATAFLEQVWRRPLVYGKSKEVIEYYPGDELSKVFYFNDRDASIAVVEPNMDPDAVPVVRFRPLRKDIRVEFTSPRDIIVRPD